MSARRSAHVASPAARTTRIKRLVGESARRRSSSPMGCGPLASGGGGPVKADSAGAFRQSPQRFLPGTDRTIGPIRSPIPSFPRAANPVRSPDGRTGTRRRRAQRVQIPGTRPQPRLRTAQESQPQPQSRSRPPRLRRVQEKPPRSVRGPVDPRSPQVVPVLLALTRQRFVS